MKRKARISHLFLYLDTPVLLTGATADPSELRLIRKRYVTTENRYQRILKCCFNDNIKGIY